GGFMRRVLHLVVAILAVGLMASTAFAQGGGASTTGSIKGKVADTSGAVLRGVTVGASSANRMGVQASVSDRGGDYRFTARPPGLKRQMPGKSGGNKFQGEIYQDYESNGMIADNINGNLPDKFAYSPANTSGIRQHSNETQKYHDSNINVGGPIKKDKVWWYFSYRNQATSVGQPNFIGPISGTLFDTSLWNPSGKTTYQINQNNKLIGYYQWGQKQQPNRLPS